VSKARSILLGLIVFAVVAALSWPLWFELALRVAPNRTSDGHPTMPIGQAAFSMLAAPLTGILAVFLVRRRL
jgi:hypothetical protein